MRVLLVLVALVPLVLSSGLSDIYTVTPYNVGSPTVYYYDNNYEHYVKNLNTDTDAYHNQWSYRQWNTGHFVSFTASNTLTEPDTKHTTLSYQYFNNLPLNPGTVLGFHVSAAAGQYAQFAYWVRTEWFQSLYSRSCWYHNDKDCYDMTQVVMCKNDDGTWDGTLDGSYWMSATYQPVQRGWYYPTEIVTYQEATTDGEYYWHIPRNSFWLQSKGAATGVAMYCRLVIPAPAFADTTMEIQHVDTCASRVVSTSSLVHAVTETLHMDDFLTIYPPIHFSYYGELVRAMTIFPMGNVQFNDVFWHQWNDLGENVAAKARFGQMTYLPDALNSIENRWYSTYTVTPPSNDRFLNSNVNDTFAHPQYHGSWPAWVKWNSWNPTHYLVFDDPYVQRSCQVSMWADWLDYRFQDLSTHAAKTVTITYGVQLGSPSVFVIRMEDVPYAGACTPQGQGVTLQLQIYEDTFNVSRMEIQYINTDKPVERFTLPTGQPKQSIPTDGFDTYPVHYWRQDTMRWDMQMPVIGMTSCDMVWGGKLLANGLDYFPANGDCVVIEGCRNSYHVGSQCVCAERFHNVNSPAVQYGIVAPRCQACPAQTFKADLSDADTCDLCPHNSIMADNIFGVDDNSECECIALFGGKASAIATFTAYRYIDSLNFDPVPVHIPCEPCAGTKSLKKFVGNVDCTCANANDYPAPMTRNSGELGNAGICNDNGYGICECRCGYTGHGYRQWSAASTGLGGPYYADCTACPANWFKPLPGNLYPGANTNLNNPGCNDCTIMTTYGPTATTTATGQCVCPCQTGATWNTSIPMCQCVPAYFYQSSPSITCQICPKNTWKSWQGNDVACTACPAGTDQPDDGVTVTLHDQREDCRCPAGYGVWTNPATGLLDCYQCYGDLWQNTTNTNPAAINTNPQCICENSATMKAYLDQSRTPNVIRCGCIKEYEYTPNNWGTCNICKETFYKNWDTVSPTTGLYCLRCNVATGATTFGTLPKDSPPTRTGFINCFCPLGKFRSAIDSCTVCPADTVMSQSCGVIAGNASNPWVYIHENTACVRCAHSSDAGYANPRASIFGYPLEWAMTTYDHGVSPTSNPGHHDEDSDCYCTDGFNRVGPGTATCGATYSCSECAPNTYRDVPTNTKMNVTPALCYNCPTSTLTGTVMVSAYRQNTTASCYCNDGEYFNQTSANLNPLLTYACWHCPASSYQKHFNREDRPTGCKTCTAPTSDDQHGACLQYSFDQATHPHWSTTDANGRAMYLMNKATRMADTTSPWYAVRNWKTWLAVPGNKLGTFDTLAGGGYNDFYYEFELDFQFLTQFTMLSQSLRLYLGGTDGISLQPGRDHTMRANEPWEIYPYYCDDMNNYTVNAYSNYLGWYGSYETTLGGGVYSNAWYIWDPNDVFLSVAMPVTTIGKRIFAIKLDGYHRYHDVYTDNAAGKGRMTIYFLVYEDTTVHAIDMFVDNAPHLCENAALTNSYSQFKCYTKFYHKSSNLAGHTTNFYAVAQDYYNRNNQPYYYVYDNDIVRFDFAWCQLCQCVSPAYYEIFPEDWDKNGCMCPCTNGHFDGTKCVNCTNLQMIDHYGVCTDLNPAGGKRIVSDTGCTARCASATMTGADCHCTCGQQYNVTSNACYNCPIGTYGTGGFGLCTKCPDLSNLTTSPNTNCQCLCDTTKHFYQNLVGGICVCAPGFYWSGSACVPCGNGTYKASYSPNRNAVTDPGLCIPCDYGYYQQISYALGSPACNPCPAGSTTTTKGCVLVSQCTCNYGYYWNGAGPTCLCCSANKYKTNNTNAFGCTDCTLNSDFDWTCAGRLECGCQKFYGLNNGLCGKCLAVNKQYKMYRGVGPCVTCPSGYNVTQQDPWHQPTFTIGAFSGTFTPLSDTPSYFTQLNNATAFGTGYFGMKTVRLFNFAATPLAYPNPEGTFKGDASFREINVYVKGQHTILFTIEGDGHNAASDYYPGPAAFKYYDIGIQFGYKIDIDTLRLRQHFANGVAQVDVSFDFEGVYDSSKVNRTNVLQFKINQQSDATASRDNQRIYLIYGQVADITVPVVAIFRNYVSSPSVIMIPADYSSNCQNQFDKTVKMSDTKGYNYWPLCKMPPSDYINAYVGNYTNGWQYVVDFHFDMCSPITTPATPCSAPQVWNAAMNRCENCPTCTIYFAGTCAINVTTGGWDPSFVWTGLFTTDETKNCVCPPGKGYVPTGAPQGSHGYCNPCHLTVKLATDRSTCLVCPVGSFYDTTVSQDGASSLSYCICNNSYTHIAHRNVANDKLDYNNWCRKCPLNSRTRAEFTTPSYTIPVGADNRKNENQCICDEWFASIQGQFDVDGVSDSKTEILDADWVCACIPGYFGTAGTPKVNADTNSPATQCLPCPKNTYTDSVNSNEPNQGTRCKACAGGLTAYNATGYKDLCYCPAGKGGMPNLITGEIACVSCVGGYKYYDGNDVCTCDIDIAVATPGVCTCPAGYAGDARGIIVNVTKECHVCPADTYKPAPANGDCTPCPFGAQTMNGTIGATSVKQCQCKADYTGLASNGTNCTYCHLGSKPVGDGIACTCQTSAGVVTGTDGLCYCAPGYYFSYLTETCVLCGADSYSTADNLDETCTACPAHETTSGSPSPFTSANDCVCMAGYEPISGVCTACAPGFHKYNPGNQPCDAGSASSKVPTSSNTGSNPNGSGNGNSGTAVLPSFVVLALALLLFLFKL